jgi:hypothetical protein
MQEREAINYYRYFPHSNRSGAIQMNSQINENRPLLVELTASQRELLNELGRRSSIGFSELRDRLDNAKALITLGYAKLIVVQNVWGIEFVLLSIKN